MSGTASISGLKVFVIIPERKTKTHVSGHISDFADIVSL